MNNEEKKPLDFILKPEGGLIQSQEWTNFWKAEGKNTIDFQISEKKFFGKVNDLSIVNYIYIPRFSFSRNLTENFDKKEFVKQLVQKAKENKSSWIRFDLIEKEDLEILKQIFPKILKKAPHDMQPKEIFIMDISLSEEELFQKMKAKTRYNIKLAEKKGVKIFSSRDPKDLKVFFDLINKTADRKKIHSHPFVHYQKMWETLPKEIVELYLAEFEGKIVAGNLMTFYGGVATYLHGGLDGESRHLMAPFLLQWRGIQEGKKRGCQWYDFGGCYSKTEDAGKQGITRFKKSFSPETDFFETMGSYDIILSPFNYYFYKFLQKVKSVFRQILR